MSVSLLKDDQLHRKDCKMSIVEVNCIGSSSCYSFKIYLMEGGIVTVETMVLDDYRHL